MASWADWIVQSAQLACMCAYSGSHVRDGRGAGTRPGRAAVIAARRWCRGKRSLAAQPTCAGSSGRLLNPHQVYPLLSHAPVRDFLKQIVHAEWFGQAIVDHHVSRGMGKVEPS